MKRKRRRARGTAMSDGEGQDFGEEIGYDEAEDEGIEEETAENVTEKCGFIEATLSPGQLMLITAAMRMGKTNEAWNLIGEALPKGYHIYTNNLFFEENEIDQAIKEGLLKQPRDYYIPVPKQVHIVTKASELIKGLYSTRKNITILDEAIFYASSKMSTSRSVRWLEGFTTQIGKLDSSLVLIIQIKSKLASMFKGELPYHELRVHKLSDERRTVEIFFYEPGDDENIPPIDTWTDVPPSRYPFDSIAPGGMEWDINMESFINKVSKLNSLKIRKEIPRILDELLSENKTQEGKYTIRGRIEDILASNPDADDKEIRALLKGKGVKCDISYIGNIRRDLKD